MLQCKDCGAFMCRDCKHAVAPKNAWKQRLTTRERRAMRAAGFLQSRGRQGARRNFLVAHPEIPIADLGGMQQFQDLLDHDAVVRAAAAERIRLAAQQRESRRQRQWREEEEAERRDASRCW